MQIENKDFLAKLKELYVRNPGQVSDIALWKLAQQCRESETYSVLNRGNTHLYAIRHNRLVFYWSDDRRHFLLTPDETRALEFLVLHVDFYRLIADRLARYQIWESHPLLYDFAFSGEAEHSDEFFVADFDFSREQDYVVAAEILNLCYATQHHCAAEVAGWSNLPVFDQSLWLWVKNRANRKGVGLGISTYQASIRECYLDWIQVLPEYRGQGLGQLLVSETIKRAAGKSDIIRVTGTVPDFYRKCGFAGTDSWRIISKLSSQT